MTEDKIQIAADFLQDLFGVDREGLAEGLVAILNNQKEATARLNAPVAQVVSYNAEIAHPYEPIYSSSDIRGPAAMTPSPASLLLTNVTLRVPPASGRRPKYLFIPLDPK